MSSNNDPVAIPMIERNPSDLPGMDSSDPDTLTGEAVLSFHNVSYRETVQSGFPFRKKTRVIERLSNINGIMRPGLNAIMGPEDGSRSWLLDVLAARKDPHGLSGDILINGKPRPANFKCISGYVPQYDEVMHTVTVRDNIEFSAALRLPVTITRDERRRRIDEVLELLHLDEVANVKPRSIEVEKRTGIAMELVTEHPILFLDDPTTDLDLRTTTDVISVLRRMSMRGRTIIFSINQPQYSIFRTFDSLTLVASGKVMYHGPAQEALEYFTSAGYEYDSHNNPADFFLDIINGGLSAILDTEEEGQDADKYKELSERQHQVTEKLANMYAKSSLYREMRTELDSLIGEQRTGRSSALEEITCVTPFWHQLGWIIHRSFKNFKNFQQFTMIQAIFAVIPAVIIGTAFRFQQNDCLAAQKRAIFLLMLTGFGCVTGLFPLEHVMIKRDRFLHEHTSGYYGVLPYFLGELLYELVPRRLLPSIIFTVIVFSIAGVKTDVNGFFAMIFTVMMLACSASSLSLSLGAVMNVPVVLPQVIYVLFMLPRFKELRRRTSIAMELVIEHPILFLDNPTTGLDLRTMTDVISVLRRISMRGRTIIFSINQAQYSIFRFFDSLTLVASGKVMYHGSAQEALEYFTSAGYEYDSHHNPADFFLDIINGGFSAILDTEEEGQDADKYKELSLRWRQVPKKLANMYAKSSIYREMRTELDSLIGEQRAGRSSALEEITCVTPFWHQLEWIIYRSFKNLKNFQQVTMIQAIVTVLLAVIIGTVFHFLQNDCVAVQSRAILLLVLTGFVCMTDLSSSEHAMIKRDHFLHEHTSGYYRVLPYFLGKLLAELVPRRLLPSTIFTVIVFGTAGVNTDVKGFFAMYFTIMMLACSASSLSLSLGAGENTTIIPSQLITIYFMLMLFISSLSLYSGIPIPELSWIEYFNIPHYGFTALQHNEFLEQNFCTEHNAAEISRCQNYVICTGEEYLTILGIDLSSWGFWKNHVVLASIIIIFLLITYVRLLFLKKKRHF